VLKVIGLGEEVETSPARSLLNCLLAGGIRVRHDCGGKALCGTCAVRVVAGERSLSPVSPLEAERLRASGRGPGWRLACQARTARDAAIELPARGSEGGGSP